MTHKKEDRRQILQVEVAFVCLFVSFSYKKAKSMSLHGSC